MKATANTHLECGICADTITISKNIQCEYCEFSACKSCWKHHILQETEPICMIRECGKVLSREFLCDKIGKTFVNTELKQHRETTLFNKEQALFPATQIEIERRKSIQKDRNALAALKHQINQLSRQYHEIAGKIFRAEQHVKTTEVKEKRDFIRHCPANDCMGYLSTAWKCGLCNMWACPDCHEIKGPRQDIEHTCNPETVESVKAIAADSKPCPKCQKLIFKIDGCDQMWCVGCETAFSWRTLRIENGPIHNPHFFQRRRELANGGEIAPGFGVNPCGERRLSHDTIRELRESFVGRNGRNFLIDIYSQDRLAEDLDGYNIIVKLMYDKIRHLIEMRQYKMPQYQVDYARRNMEYRVDYMTHKITKEQFCTMIQRQEKKSNKNHEIYNILDVFYQTSSDIIQRFIIECRTTGKFSCKIYAEFGELLSYCNKHLENIAKTYGSIQMHINKDTFEFTALKK